MSDDERPTADDGDEPGAADDGGPVGGDEPEVGDGAAAPLADETAWMCQVLQVDEADWAGIVSVAEPLAAYEIQSALIALDELPGCFDSAAFNQGYQSTRRIVTVPVGLDTGRAVPALGTAVAYTSETGQAAVARIEHDASAGAEPQLVVYGADLDAVSAGLDALVDLIRGKSSTWRRQPVLFDPTPAALFRHLDPDADTPSPAERLVDELESTICRPIEQWALAATAISRRSLLLVGAPGTGKSSAVRWLAGRLAGTATTIVAPPRAMANADLVHLAFDMAADDAPAVVVLEHLDLLLGDRFSARYPESLTELVAQLDELSARPGVFTLATATHADSLDRVLLARFDRRVELADAVQRERRALIERLVADHADGSATLVDALLRTTRGWRIGKLAELGRLAALAGLPPSHRDDTEHDPAHDDATEDDDAAGDRPPEDTTIDLIDLAARVDRTVHASDSDDADGTYL